MANETTAATSPASPEGQTGDGKETGSGNLTLGQAAIRLIAADTAKRDAAQQAPVEQAAAKTAPEEEAQTSTSEETTNATAEAEAASVAPEPEEIAADEAEKARLAGTTPKTGDDDVLSPKPTLDKEPQDRIQKRIDEIASQKKAAEAQVEMLQRELADLKNKPDLPPIPVVLPPFVGQPPLPEVKDAQGLESLRDQALAAIRECEELLETPRRWKQKEVDDGNGSTLTVNVTQIGDKEFTEEMIRATKRNARDTLDSKIPKQEKFL